MSKISKKLRAEAIELAGIDATFWADESLKSHHGDDQYRRAVLRLVSAAKEAAVIDYVDNAANPVLARLSAEAQAMLIEGWSPS